MNTPWCAVAGQSRTSSAHPSISLKVGHHVLDSRVVLEAVHGQVLAVAAVFEASVWHLGHDGNVGVDPHTAEIHLSRHPHRPAEVLGPDTAGQSVLDAVGPGERLG